MLKVALAIIFCLLLFNGNAVVADTIDLEIKVATKCDSWLVFPIKQGGEIVIGATGGGSKRDSVRLKASVYDYYNPPEMTSPLATNSTSGASCDLKLKARDKSTLVIKMNSIYNHYLESSVNILFPGETPPRYKLFKVRRGKTDIKKRFKIIADKAGELIVCGGVVGPYTGSMRYYHRGRWDQTGGPFLYARLDVKKGESVDFICSYGMEKFIGESYAGQWNKFFPEPFYEMFVSWDVFPK